MFSYRKLYYIKYEIGKLFNKEINNNENKDDINKKLNNILNINDNLNMDNITNKKIIKNKDKKKRKGIKEKV